MKNFNKQRMKKYKKNKDKLHCRKIKVANVLFFEDKKDILKKKVEK